MEINRYEKTHQILDCYVLDIHSHHPMMGYRQIRDKLRIEFGWIVSEPTVWKSMTQLGIHGYTRRRKATATGSNLEHIRYGYIKAPETKKLEVDEEAASIVRRIFAMCAAGSGPSQIARVLTKEQIRTPATYAYTKYGVTHAGVDTQHPYRWSGDTVADMLENELYLGNTVNTKYSTKSCKDKRRIERSREECLVFENTHPALVTREVWDIVQRV